FGDFRHFLEMVPVICAGAKQRAGIENGRIELSLRQRNAVTRFRGLRCGVQARMHRVPRTQQAEYRTRVGIHPLEQRCSRHDLLADQHAGNWFPAVCITDQPISRCHAPPRDVAATCCYSIIASAAWQAAVLFRMAKTVWTISASLFEMFRTATLCVGRLGKQAW